MPELIKVYDLDGGVHELTQLNATDMIQHKGWTTGLPQHLVVHEKPVATMEVPVEVPKEEEKPVEMESPVEVPGEFLAKMEADIPEVEEKVEPVKVDKKPRGRPAKNK